MEDTLISYKTAKLAKEKGFDIEVQAMTCGEGYPIVFNPQEESPYNWNSRNGYSIPTQSLLQKWLREKLNIYINACIGYSEYTPCDSVYFQYELLYITDRIDGQDYGANCHKEISKKRNYSTYEEALEEGLYQALNLIKDE